MNQFSYDIRNAYYVYMLVVSFGAIVGAYFASRAGVKAELKNIIERQDKAEETVNSIQGDITKLNRDLGRLEGRLNGRS